MELRAGQAANARRLAEEAFSPQYGVQAEATQLLRSIDAEEYNQKVLAASHAFDAGQAAFQRHEFARAATMFRSVDSRLLPSEKQARLKEYMLTPEMQSNAIAQVGLKSPEMDATVGRVQVGDSTGVRATSDADFAQQVKAMQEVKFQKLRADGLQAQNDAMKLFQAGETDRALDTLEEYERSLKEAGIDADHVDILRRQIESRYLSLKTLKHQRDFQTKQANASQAADLSRSKQALQEEEKKKQISELMKQYHALYKEAKYEQAEVVAMRAQELDPDDERIGAAIYMAQMHKNSTQYNDAKKRRENQFVNALDDAEDQGPDVSRNPLAIDAKRALIASKRKPLDLPSLTSPEEREGDRDLSQTGHADHAAWTSRIRPCGRFLRICRA